MRIDLHSALCCYAWNQEGDDRQKAFYWCRLLSRDHDGSFFIQRLQWIMVPYSGVRVVRNITPSVAPLRVKYYGSCYGDEYPDFEYGFEDCISDLQGRTGGPAVGTRIIRNK